MFVQGWSRMKAACILARIKYGHFFAAVVVVAAVADAIYDFVIFSV